MTFRPYSKEQQLRPTTEEVNFRAWAENGREARKPSPILKAKKCRWCKNKFTPKNSMHTACSTLCAMKISKLQAIKKENKAWGESKKVLKEKTMTLSDYEKEAKRVFQKWVRKRDQHLDCISCGKPSNRYDAGHYFDAGTYSGLIFNHDNCNKQCSNFCNRLNHGNKANYRIGLIKKIGLERVLWLEENKDRLKDYKYTKSELIEIKNKYTQLLKEF